MGVRPTRQAIAGIVSPRYAGTKSDPNSNSSSKSSGNNNSHNLATLRVHGPDGKGIVAGCFDVLNRRGYDIVGTEHWTDRKVNMLFLRIAFDKEPKQQLQQQLQSHDTTTATTSTTEKELEQFCQARNLHYALNWRNQRARVAIMVSKYDHCLWELLLRHQACEMMDCDIVAVLSNHETLRPVADTFGIPFRVFPITPSTKIEQERLEIEYLQQQLQVDVVVLARYMQVLTPQFLEAFPNRIINIHHSFLPAFMGGRPHHAAYARGVKLVGATAHYVTPELDGGPIIEQVGVRQ